MFFFIRIDAIPLRCPWPMMLSAKEIKINVCVMDFEVLWQLDMHKRKWPIAIEHCAAANAGGLIPTRSSATFTSGNKKINVHCND